MADRKQAEKADPTVRSGTAGDRYPEGTHPAVPLDEGDDAAIKKVYRERDDVPESTIAQVEVRPDEQ